MGPIDLSKSWIPDSEVQKESKGGQLIKDDSIQQLETQQQKPKAWTPFEPKDPRTIAQRLDIVSRRGSKMNGKYGNELIPNVNYDGASQYSGFNDSIN